MTATYDILANRGAVKWSKKELAGRMLWEILRGPLLAWTPRQLRGFRRSVLQVEGGVPVKDLCSKHGFSDATFYKWRSRLGGLDVSEARRLRKLESENTKFKKLLAEAMLDIESLKVVARGKR